MLFALVLLLGTQLDWRAFSPADGAFTVQMPGKPIEFKKTLDSPAGSIEVLVYELPVSGGKFAVGYSQYPEGTVKAGTEDKRLDNARDGAVASSKGKLKREKSLLVDTYPGRELTLELEGKGLVLMRLYAVKNRLYQIVVTGPSDLATSQDAQKFLNSFRLK